MDVSDFEFVINVARVRTLLMTHRTLSVGAMKESGALVNRVKPQQFGVEISGIFRQPNCRTGRRGV